MYFNQPAVLYKRRTTTLFQPNSIFTTRRRTPIFISTTELYRIRLCLCNYTYKRRTNYIYYNFRAILYK